jgi:hypothetical protein
MIPTTINAVSVEPMLYPSVLENRIPQQQQQ